jgi:preprotein translocase subunit Sec61beta
MAKQKKGEGFHSAAGLIRYFDAEEKTSLRIPPWLVAAMCVATIVIVTIVHLMWPLVEST